MNRPVQFHSRSVEQTAAVGAAVARRARPGDVVALIGELGTGKTQFVRGMAQGLGIDPTTVRSPTFVLVQEYQTENSQPLVLVHIDAYRLHGPGELAAIGWDGVDNELASGQIVAVEWADRIMPILGPQRLEVRIEHWAKGRRLTFIPHGRWNGRMAKLLPELKSLLGSMVRQGLAAEPGRRERRCPVCGKPSSRSDCNFPFCSGRCRTIDLGSWFDEKYLINRPIEQSDLEEGE